ncbi:MAG: sulfatase-like hydrolase/transferase [Pseudomonadota bacterium]
MKEPASFRAILKKVLPLRLGFMNAAVTLLQCVFFSYFLYAGLVPRSGVDILRLLLSIVTANVIVLLVNTALSRTRRLRVAVSLVLFFLYGALYSYHLRASVGLDYAVVRDNFSEAFHYESLVYVIDSLGAAETAIVAAITAALLVLEIKRGGIAGQRQDSPLVPKLIASAAAVALIVASPVALYDDMANFFQTARQYYSGSSGDDGSLDELDSFVMKKNRVKSGAGPAPGHEAGRRPPNIFLIAIESFKANFVEAWSPGGAEVMPFFNSLIGRGLYVENYYANSIQTSKGHFSILFSVVPSVWGKVFVRFSNRHFYSLPRALQDRGYETIFYQAYDDLNFDNTKGFLSANGFSRIKSAVDPTKKEDPHTSWGWGLQDDVFYERFFKYMDGLNASGEAGGKPLFAILATIMNHPAFDMIPKENRLIYPKPETARQRYANSAHLTDMFLKRFFEELEKRAYLEDSVVILTGDHSFPVGEHNLYGREEGFFEEFFRVPFLMLGEGWVKPRRIEGAAYSHLDIAPTVLDLLNLSVENGHFQGVSMFDKDLAAHPVYLVQPYCGKYLGVVSYPYKYVKRLTTQKEFLFDLRSDPDEHNNLVKQPELKTVLENLRMEWKFILFNQKMIEKDTVWPVQVRHLTR